ncbi:hypothetical protein HDU84_009202, partial [Entophlyctis sp. JEL0112]
MLRNRQAQPQTTTRPKVKPTRRTTGPTSTQARSPKTGIFGTLAVAILLGAILVYILLKVLAGLWNGFLNGLKYFFVVTASISVIWVLLLKRPLHILWNEVLDFLKYLIDRSTPQDGDKIVVQSTTMFGKRQLNATAVDFFNAYHLSQMAYHKDGAKTKTYIQNNGTKFDLVSHHQVKNIRYSYATMGADVSYVAFRGTSDFRDVLADLNIRPDVVCNGLVHKGFRVAVNETLGQIMKHLRERITASKNNGKRHKIVFCGHSLGGARAHTAHYGYITDEEVRGILGDVETVSLAFGAPFFGSSYNSDTVSKRNQTGFITIVNKNDPVIGILNIVNALSAIKPHELLTKAILVSVARKLQIYSQKMIDLPETLIKVLSATVHPLRSLILFKEFEKEIKKGRDQVSELQRKISGGEADKTSSWYAPAGVYLFLEESEERKFSMTPRWNRSHVHEAVLWEANVVEHIGDHFLGAYGTALRDCSHFTQLFVDRQSRDVIICDISESERKIYENFLNKKKINAIETVNQKVKRFSELLPDLICDQQKLIDSTEDIAALIFARDHMEIMFQQLNNRKETIGQEMKEFYTQQIEPVAISLKNTNQDICAYVDRASVLSVSIRNLLQNAKDEVARTQSFDPKRILEELMDMSVDKRVEDLKQTANYIKKCLTTSKTKLEEIQSSLKEKNVELLESFHKAINIAAGAGATAIILGIVVAAIAAPPAAAAAAAVAGGFAGGAVQAKTENDAAEALQQSTKRTLSQKKDGELLLNELQFLSALVIRLTKGFEFLSKDVGTVVDKIFDGVELDSWEFKEYLACWDK